MDKNFEFNGDWEYSIHLPSFSGFQSRNGPYTSKDSEEPSSGEITLVIEDDLSDRPDPYPEQIAAIEYIFNNQDRIIESVIIKTLKELPVIVSDYGLEKKIEVNNLNRENIKSLMGFSQIEIKIPSKDGISYFDLIGGGEWDEEHGLNILMHNDRVVTFSDIDGNSGWDAIKDNGTYEILKKQSPEKIIQKKYEAHPKFNKLKPSHKYANENFAVDLIRGKFNDIFMSAVENDDIDISNDGWKSQSKSLIQVACSFNNYEIVKFLIDKDVNIEGAIHECFDINANNKEIDGNIYYKIVELLLEKGTSVNDKNKYGRTILYELCGELSSWYGLIEQNPESRNNERFLMTKKIISELFRLGAILDTKTDPFDNPLEHAFRGGRTKESKIEITDFLTGQYSKYSKIESNQKSTSINTVQRPISKPKRIDTSKDAKLVNTPKKWWQFWKS